MPNPDISIPLDDIVRCPACLSAASLQVNGKHLGQWLLEELQKGERGRDPEADDRYCECLACCWIGRVGQAVEKAHELED